MEDLRGRLSDPDVRALLAMSLGAATDERVDAAARCYERDGWHLFGVEVDGRIAGVVGVELSSEESGTIRHVAVAPTLRRAGLARGLVTGVVSELGLQRLSAETDDDAVGFYRSTGFVVRDAPARFGRRRYECELSV